MKADERQLGVRSEELGVGIFSPLTPHLSQEFFWLASYALGVDVATLMARKDFTPDELAKLKAVFSRREAHEPLQYIMGVADFYGRDFEVGPGVLIPRHDTETLIEAAKEIFEPEKVFKFLDWGTGSGCIAITILLEFKGSFAYMLDQSSEAISYAKRNLTRYGLNDRAEIASAIHEKNFDLIVSNPPYIPSGEIETLMPEVRDYEPRLALDGGEDGMNFYRLIFSQAKEILKPGGYIILETGNATQVTTLKFFDDDFVFVKEFFDLGNFLRCLLFKFKGRD